ncbi:hypothetical protein KP509_1Z207200 [Ceratopteris richardii]|nr:hypothetical protein KP509_1Z207200 [Ceratopteris richardii]
MQNHLRTPQVLYLVVLLCVLCVNIALIVRAARPYEADGANQSGAPAGDVAEGNGDLGTNVKKSTTTKTTTMKALPCSDRN